MSFQERNVVASLVVSVLFFVLLLNWIHFPLRDIGPDAVGGISGQSWLTLKLIGIGIIANIICVILFNIVYAMVTNDKDPSTLVDERDRRIEYDGDRFGNYLTGAIFIAGLFAASYGWSAEWVLLVITYGFFFGSLLSAVIRLFQHRRGY